MQAEKIEQIKSLIKTSRILNDAERAEWLSLLELMNDKQLNELDKILNSVQLAVDSGQKKPAESMEHKLDSDKAKISNSQLPTPNQKPAGQSASFQPVRPHIPSLSHIMNLPKTFDGKASPLKLSQKTVAPQAQMPVKESSPAVASKTVKPKQNFTEKLKAIFAEKELTAGVPDKELSLPNRIETKTPSATVVKTAERPPEKEKPPVVVAQQVIIQGPVKFSTEQSSQGDRLVISSQPKNTPPPVKLPPVVPKPSAPPVKPPVKINPPAEIAAALSKLGVKPAETIVKQQPVPARPPVSLKTADDKHKPGLHLVEESTKSREDVLAELKQHMAPAKEGLQISPQKNKPVEYHEPKELALMKLESFADSSLENFVKAIKHLIGKYGYYEVIFNIEKSPLYQAYVATGVELMSQQQTFETFSPEQTMNKFLDRESFEKFTDLLRMIASS